MAMLLVKVRLRKFFGWWALFRRPPDLPSQLELQLARQDNDRRPRNATCAVPRRGAVAWLRKAKASRSTLRAWNRRSPAHETV